MKDPLRVNTPFPRFREEGGEGGGGRRGSCVLPVGGERGEGVRGEKEIARGGGGGGEREREKIKKGIFPRGFFRTDYSPRGEGGKTGDVPKFSEKLL